MRRAVFLGFLLLSTTLFAAERNILEEEAINTQALIAEIKRLDKRNSIGNATEVVSHWQNELFLIQERNARFKGRASSREFCVYAETQAVAERYLKEAQSVLDLYEKLFPRSNFLPASPAQILIYSREDDYLKYEHIPAGVVGHTHAMRSKKMAIVKRSSVYSIEPVTTSNIKDHRLATYQQDVPYVFAHEVSHILTYELVNPGRMSINDVETSLFLNEGLAEYFSAKLFPDGFEKRLEVLRDSHGISPLTPDLMAKDMTLNVQSAKVRDIRLEDYLKKDAYPTGAEILQFYSEATLFVSWLMQLPGGSELVSALLVTPDAKQMEVQLRQYQRKHNLPITGWEQYQPYRKQVLVTARKKAATEPAQAK
jgi:hypothetical protein